MKINEDFQKDLPGLMSGTRGVRGAIEHNGLGKIRTSMSVVWMLLLISKMLTYDLRAIFEAI